VAGSKSNALETDYLTWALSATAVTRPTAWYVGLFTDTGAIVTDQPTTEANTTNCPGYARKAVTSWTISSNQAQNASAATFTASGGAWATVKYWGIFDSLTAGRLLYWGDMTAQTLADTNVLDFPINSLTLNED
jgi:hypothetical protein